jgi:carbon monoxide dehydrogenase subunit G
MRLENSFEVPAPPEEAWELLLDVPRVVALRSVWRLFRRVFGRGER